MENPSFNNPQEQNPATQKSSAFGKIARIVGFGSAIAMSGAAAEGAQAQDMHVQINKPTEITVNAPSAAPELKAPEGLEIRLNKPKEVNPAQAAPAQEVRVNTPAEYQQATPASQDVRTNTAAPVEKAIPAAAPEMATPQTVVPATPEALPEYQKETPKAVEKANLNDGFKM